MKTWTVITWTLLYRLVKLLVAFISSSLLAKTIEKRSGKKRLKGITIGAIIIVTMALYELIRLVDWNYYQFTFQGLSQQVILARYVYSISWRLAILVSGIGLLYLNERARKAIIFLACFQILTIPWKHPLFVFKHLVFTQSHPGEAVHPWVPWVGFLFFSAFDLITAFLVIYYFNRPLIKQEFMKK